MSPTPRRCPTGCGGLVSPERGAYPEAPDVAPDTCNRCGESWVGYQLAATFERYQELTKAVAP